MSVLSPFPAHGGYLRVGQVPAVTEHAAAPEEKVDINFFTLVEPHFSHSTRLLMLLTSSSNLAPHLPHSYS